MALNYRADVKIKALESLFIVDIAPELLDFKQKKPRCHKKTPKADFGG
jgi:hypothetical protein